MIKTLVSAWQYIAVAFAAGLALGYVGAVFQFEHAVISHADKVAAEQHKADVKQAGIARDVSKDAQRRHDIGVHSIDPVLKTLSAAPQKPPVCDLDQSVLDALNKAGE